ncbi:MAG: thioredoxin domain-containing protein [Smithella sp.]|jgi:thiol:disulfide interchange protein DsbA
MSIKDFIKKYRNLMTIALSLIGIGIMAYYDYCDTACSYLKGDIWGIDLKWVGIAYMAAIIAFAAFKQTSFVRALLAAGLGVEVHLYAFQVQNDVYCPFCLAFSIMLILSFIINYEVPSAWRENRRRMWLYFLGEVDFSMFRIHKLPLLLFSLLGYLTILFTFSASVTPAYGQDSTSSIPSLGKGKYEIVMFADYFCPPCRRIDTKAEPLLKELLSTNKVKITFVDVPLHSASPIYAKYYLYAANANPGANSVLHIRKMLFEAAQTKHIETEKDLVAYLKKRKISWKIFDEKSILTMLSAIIKENNILATPTCVVRYSATDVKKIVGDDEIWNGLTTLKTHISASKK